MGYICEKCNAHFNFPCEYKKHLEKKISCISKQCSTCKEYFASKHTLKKHIDKNICIKKLEKLSQITAESIATKATASANVTSSQLTVSDNNDLILKLELTREEIKKSETDIKKAEAEAKKAETDIKKAEAEAKVLELQIKLKTNGENVQIVNNINGNVNGNINQVVQLVSLGNENLGGLTQSVMSIISNDPKKEIPSLAVQKLYFNPHIPENQIVKPKLIKVYPDKPQSLYSESVDLRQNGQWVNFKVDEASEIILNNTSNALKRRLNEVPLQSNKRERLKSFLTNYEREEDIKDEMLGELGCNLDIMPIELESYKRKQVTFCNYLE